MLQHRKEESIYRIEKFIVFLIHCPCGFRKEEDDFFVLVDLGLFGIYLLLLYIYIYIERQNLPKKKKRELLDSPFCLIFLKHPKKCKKSNPLFPPTVIHKIPLFLKFKTKFEDGEKMTNSTAT